MKKPWILMIAVFLLVTPFSMAALSEKTEVVSLRDPGFPDREIKKVLVWYNTDDLFMECKTEKLIVENLKKQNIDATPCVDLFIPTRQYSAIEMKKTLGDKGVDSIINIAKLTRVAMNIKSGPISLSSDFGQMQDGTPIVQMATASGCLMESEIKLTDTATGNLIWTATLKSTIKSQNDYKGLMGSYAKNLSAAMVKDKLIKK